VAQSVRRSAGRVAHGLRRGAGRRAQNERSIGSRRLRRRRSVSCRPVGAGGALPALDWPELVRLCRPSPYPFRSYEPSVGPPLSRPSWPPNDFASLRADFFRPAYVTHRITAHPILQRGGRLVARCRGHPPAPACSSGITPPKTPANLAPDSLAVSPVLRHGIQPKSCVASMPRRATKQKNRRG